MQVQRPEDACKLLVITPTPPELEADHLYLLSHCLHDQGQTTAAIQAMQRVAKLLPNAATPRAELASMYARQGNAQATYTPLIAAAELDTAPDSDSAKRNMPQLPGET